jgi:DNA-binding beta-propeller fold protein YncE
VHTEEFAMPSRLRRFAASLAPTSATRTLGAAILVQAIVSALAAPAAAQFPPFVASWAATSSYSIAVDNQGYLYSANPLNNRIEKYTDTGAFVLQWGAPGNGNGQFNSPCGVAVDGNGNVYIADTGNRRVQKFTSSGAYITQWGSLGGGDGQFNQPYNLAVDAAGTHVYVTDVALCRVQVFDGNGTFLSKWGSYGTGNGQFSGAYGVALDASGNVFVSDDGSSCRIEEFTSSGGYLTQWGSCYTNNLDTQDCGIWSISIGPGGVIAAADAGCNMIKEFSATGTLLFRSSTTLPSGCTPGLFGTPYGIAVDNLGNLYVASTHDNCIHKYGPGGSTPAHTSSWGRLKVLYR